MTKCLLCGLFWDVVFTDCTSSHSKLDASYSKSVLAFSPFLRFFIFLLLGPHPLGSPEYRPQPNINPEVLCRNARHSRPRVPRPLPPLAPNNGGCNRSPTDSLPVHSIGVESRMRRGNSNPPGAHKSMSSNYSRGFS